MACRDRCGRCEECANDRSVPDRSGCIVPFVLIVGSLLGSFAYTINWVV